MIRALLNITMMASLGLFASCDIGKIKNVSCGDAALERTMYQKPTAEVEGGCVAEIQSRTCKKEVFSQWNGSFQYPTCDIDPPKAGAFPRWQFESLEYVGGFRVTNGKVGDGDNSTLGYSPGIFTIDTANNTLFMPTHDYEQGFGELALPELTYSTNPRDFAVADNVVQRFVDIYETERDVTGIDNYFKVTGMHKIGDQLLVNYFNWYDAPGTETDTTMIFKDAKDLAQSALIGPFQMRGAAHAGGWISEIPAQWQHALGGTHVSGMSQGSIISRLSVGPTAFIWSPADDLLSATTGGTINNSKAMDFSLKNMLFNVSLYTGKTNKTDDLLYNRIDGQNNLWTIVSAAQHGFIIPNTSTYFVLGYSGGHHSGLGYKITQDSGRLCGGPCPYEADDSYNYYWLFDVNDLVAVLNNEMEPYEVRPYDYGEFNTIGNKSNLAGGFYDADKDLLYISLRNGDPIPTYGKPPLFLAYHLNAAP